jgi:glycosyltransferase involved in cell wall biosynthesis
MKITIFLLCYNEEILLPKTIEHYRKYMPESEIVIYDNYSTDNSVEVASSMGCKINYFDTNNKLDEIYQTHLKNNCWKHVESGWIIVCDMDEWLCIDQESIEEEDSFGNTIIQTFGMDIIANSKSNYINDIKIHNEHYAVKNEFLNKQILFKAGAIKDINYSPGAHSNRPVGNVVYGGSYLLKHMNWLGLSYKIRLNRSRFERSQDMRALGLGIHYKENDTEIRKSFEKNMKLRKDISDLCNCF